MLILKLCIHFLIFKEDAKVIRNFTYIFFQTFLEFFEFFAPFFRSNLAYCVLLNIKTALVLKYTYKSYCPLRNQFIV